MDLPIDDAIAIQEALKPLGYAVCGYHAGSVVTIELLPGRTLPYRESPDYPGGIADVGTNEQPDNGLHGTEWRLIHENKPPFIRAQVRVVGFGQGD
jgi:hypothetical protein